MMVKQKHKFGDVKRVYFEKPNSSTVVIIKKEKAK